MKQTRVLQIQRLANRDPDRWSNWETPPDDPIAAHEALVKTSRDWPTDRFRLVWVITEEIKFAVNGETEHRIM